MAFWSLVKSSRWRPKRTTRSRLSRRKEKARDQSPPPSSATLPALGPYRSPRKRAAASRSTDSSSLQVCRLQTRCNLPGELLDDRLRGTVEEPLVVHAAANPKDAGLLA